MDNSRLTKFFTEKFQDADRPDFEHNEHPNDKTRELLDRKVFGVDGSLMQKRVRQEYETVKVRE